MKPTLFLAFVFVENLLSPAQVKTGNSEKTAPNDEPISKVRLREPVREVIGLSIRRAFQGGAEAPAVQTLRDGLTSSGRAVVTKFSSVFIRVHPWLHFR